jgi:hypothetical protein
MLLKGRVEKYALSSKRNKLALPRVKMESTIIAAFEMLN